MSRAVVSGQRRHAMGCVILVCVLVNIRYGCCFCVKDQAMVSGMVLRYIRGFAHNNRDGQMLSPRGPQGNLLQGLIEP
jgi:hypothetical protein